MRKTVILLVIGAMLLQGCAAVVVATGATAAVVGSSMATDKRSAKTIMQDRDITYKAQMKINKDYALARKAHVSVTALNGVVLLVGQTPTADLRTHAANLVSEIPGIRLLRNEITLDYAATPSMQARDTWLTTKVKSALLAEQGIHSERMKVVTEDQVVYLMGLVTQKQGDLAAHKVSQVDGVKKVVKLFEYI